MIFPNSSQNNPRSGHYYDNVQITLYQGSSTGSIEQELSTTFWVNLVVTQKIDISIVDEGGVFNQSSTSKVLDFGNMQQYQTMGADLMVVSNSPYQIFVSSMNNGKLKNSTSTIDYELKVNSSTVNLGSSSSSAQLIATGSPTSQIGSRYNMKFKILSDTTSKLAGLYQDVLTVTAVAN